MTTLKQYRLALQIFQSNRLRRDYPDLSAIKQYHAVGEFFFTEIYGPRDFSERDNGARRLQGFLHLVPGVMAEDVEQVLELLDLTNHLDHDLALVLHGREVGLNFNEAVYEECYRRQNNYDDRLRQLKLVDRSLYDVFRLSRIGLLGTALRRTRLVAQLTGIDGIHQFLLKGYDALRPVQDITLFAQTIYDRELERLNRIYQHDDAGAS
jgi:hypothetical protein